MTTKNILISSMLMASWAALAVNLEPARRAPMTRSFCEKLWDCLRPKVSSTVPDGATEPAPIVEPMGAHALPQAVPAAGAVNMGAAAVAAPGHVAAAAPAAHGSMVARPALVGRPRAGALSGSDLHERRSDETISDSDE